MLFFGSAISPLKVRIPRPMQSCETERDDMALRDNIVTLAKGKKGLLKRQRILDFLVVNRGRRKKARMGSHWFVYGLMGYRYMAKPLPPPLSGDKTFHSGDSARKVPPLTLSQAAGRRSISPLHIVPRSLDRPSPAPWNGPLGGGPTEGCRKLNGFLRWCDGRSSRFAYQEGLETATAPRYQAAGSRRALLYCCSVALVSACVQLPAPPRGGLLAEDASCAAGKQTWLATLGSRKRDG